MTLFKTILISTLATCFLVLAGCLAQTTISDNTNQVIVDENTNTELDEEVNFTKVNNINSIPEVTTKKESLSSEELDWLEGYDISLDHPSFEILNDDLAKDARAVYSKSHLRDENNDLQPYIDIVHEADPATSTIIRETYPILFKDKDTLFIRNYPQGFIPINEIDVFTFQLVQDESMLGEDNQHYLFESTEDKGYLVVRKDTFIKLDSTYAKDDKNVYIAEVYNNGYQVFDEADLNTFRVLEYGYAYDERTVYAPHILYEGKVMNELEEADQSSFRVLSSGMAIDENNIYINGNLFDQFQVDLPTFRYTGVPEFFYDKNSAYIFRANSGFKLEDIDIVSFEAITSYGSSEGIWWKDDNGVYIGILDELNEVAGKYNFDYGKIDVDSNTFTDLVTQNCDDVEYVHDCQDYDRFYSYKDKDGSYGFPSSVIISHTEGYIPQQTIIIEE